MRYGTFAIFFVLLASGIAPARSTTRAINSDRRKTHQQVERTIAADPRVVMSVCVVSGNVTVRSWDRNEVHVRVSDGIPIELSRVDQTSSKSATELTLTTKGSRNARASSCLPLGDIELDVPRSATLKIETTNGDVQVTEVARITATSQSGAMRITRVRDETDVNTIGGEISVRDSTGSFKLHTIGGSVDARDLRPSAAGDAFEAVTVGGDLTIGRVQHQQLKVNTVSGDIDFDGPLARGGRYRFQSLSGRVRLSLPANSSFRLNGTLGGSGEMSNDFKLTQPTPKHGAMRRLEGIVGGGDASINISVFSGFIQIRKQ